MPVNVGTAFVDIRPDLSGFGREIQTSMGRDLDSAGAEGGRKLGGSFIGGFKAGIAGLGAIGAAVGLGQVFDFLGGSIDAASALSETLSKSNTVFRESAREMTAWAAAGAENFGLSTEAALAAASGFGNMFAQLGIGTETAAEMSRSIVELSADFASFHNADISQVLDAQSAAFRGEYDSLQRFLPLINAATVEQRALELTGKRTTAALTAQDKALAVNALMFEGAGDALGDFDRTSDSLANTQRTLNATWENARAELGEQLMPVMASVASFLTDTGIPAFLKLTEVVGEGFADAAGFFIGALTDVMSVIAKGLEKIDQFVPGLEGVPEALREQVTEARYLEGQLHNVHIELDGVAGSAEDAATQTGVLSTTLAPVADILRRLIPDTEAHTVALEEEEDATRELGKANRELDRAQRDYQELLARGAVDEEKVADARLSLAQASRSAAAADRDLADAEEAYAQAVAEAAVLHGFDTAQERVEDAYDSLLDAQDAAASAHERAAEAEKDLREAQQGDPDYQNKLADARDRVAIATEKVAEKNTAVATTARDAAAAANTLTEGLGDVNEQAGLLIPKLGDIGGLLGGLAAAGGNLQPLARQDASPFAPIPETTVSPLLPSFPALLGLPTTTATTKPQTNTFNMVFNEKVDPQQVAAEVSWALIP